MAEPEPIIDLDRNSGIVSLGTKLFKVVETKTADGPSGFPNVTVVCEVQDQGEDKGKRVWHNLSLNPTARFKVDEFLDAIGAAKKGQMRPSEFVGRLFKAEVIHEEYPKESGQMRAHLSKPFPYGTTTAPGGKEVKPTVSNVQVNQPSELKGGVKKAF